MPETSVGDLPRALAASTLVVTYLARNQAVALLATGDDVSSRRAATFFFPALYRSLSSSAVVGRVQ